jgi:predicted lipoprotein
MNRIIKYTTGVLALIIVIFLSLDIRKLDEYKAVKANVKFDATEFAGQFWENQLADCINNAQDVKTVFQEIEQNPELAFEKYAHKLGISKTYYLILKGSGVIESVDQEYLLVRIDENTQVQVATDFIFGNAVRDGSGKVDINQFLNMTDFNNVSVALNKLVKEKTVSRLKKSAKTGMQIEFTGATEISEENTDLTAIRFIPITAKLTDG